jgi:hypothetical protein
MQNAARKSPMQLFAKTEVMVNPKHYQPFGCPVYVLDNSLQANRPHHKWNERSRVGINLGHSPLHGRNVSLVLNRTTGLVSPQFHVKYDPLFHTVKQDYFDSQWQNKAGFIKQEPGTASQSNKGKTIAKTAPKSSNAPAVIPTSEGGKGMSNSEGVDTTTTNQRNKEGTQQKHAGQEQTDMGQTNPLKRQVEELQHKPKVTPLSTQISRKKLKTSEQRQVPQNDKNLKSTTWPKDSVTPNLVLGKQPSRAQTQSHVIEAMLTEISENTKGDIEGEIFCYEAMNPQDAENCNMGDDPLYAFKATADPDTMYLHQALREPDKGEFIKAMNKEVKDQMNNGNFSIVKASTVPKGTTVFPAVWQMRRKRDIKTREIKKYKARLNVDGSKMQQGIHYEQSYAPVASWKSIRLLLTMVAQHGWHSKQLDYVLQRVNTQDYHTP